MTHAKMPLKTTSLTVDQAFQQAANYHQAGYIHDAEHLYRTILQIQPNHPDAQHNLDVLTEQIKQAITNLSHFRAELEANTDQAQYWFNYIDALTLTDQTDLAQQILHLGQKHGLPDEMVSTLAKRLEYAQQESTQSPHEKSLSNAIAILKNKKTSISNKNTQSDKNSSSHNEEIPSTKQIDTLIHLFNAGQYTEVVTLSRKMTECFPHYDFGWKTLGTVLKQMGRDTDALHPLEKAVELSPDDAETLNNLSITYKVLGQIDKAETSCRRAIQIMPDLAEAHNTLGIILHELGRFSEAEASHRRAIQIKPDYVSAYNNLGTALKDMGQFDEAEANCLQALEINQRSSSAYITLGTIYHDLRQFGNAETKYRQALEIDPNYAIAHYNLGNTFKQQDLLDKAEASYRQALIINPDYALAHNNLGDVLKEHCLFDEAEACYRRSLQLQPDFEVAFSNLLFVLNYHPDKTAEEIFAAYQEYNEKYCLPHHCEWQSHKNNRNLHRRLKVGYVSPDFRKHSAQYFLEPLIVHHEKQAVEVYAYAELAVEDSVTAHYRGYVDHWIPTRGMSNAALAKRIRADGIDILVDLAGHTAKNRLSVFARKPAPVSISWLGYGYTTGLTAIDYFLTDITTVPQNSEALFSETPYRVATPSFCYHPAEGMGKINDLPALANGHITFGTLTRAIRLNHRTIKIWSEILNRVPDSRLVIDCKAFSDKHMQDLFAEKFVAHGIARKRLEFGYHTPPWDVLRGIDIGLDCFPHNSGTTLFETLYMGIPYITLAERPSVGRLGSCILQGLGRPEWIAESEADYVAKAVELAGDTNRLSEIRAGLRDQMENSPLRDEKNFVLKVETAYRDIWKIWCQKNDKENEQTAASAIERTLQQAIDYHRSDQLSDAVNTPHNKLSKTKTLSTKKRKSSKKQKTIASSTTANQQLPQTEIDQLVTLFNAGNHTELEIKARLLIDQYPNAGFAWKVLGASLQMQNKEALQALRKATELLPDDAQAHSNLGVLLEKLGQFEASTASCRRALQIDPNSAAAHCNLGNALLGSKQLNDAVESYRQALTIKPDYIEARNNLANALTRLGQLDNAVSSCRQVLEINPDFANAHNNLGIAQKNLGQLNDAIESYHRALVINPDYAEAHNNLGNALKELGRFDEAVASIQHALTIKPQYAEAYNNLGNTLQSLGQFTDAETSIRRAFEINPDEATAYNNLLFLLNYHPDLSAEEIYRAYQDYDTKRCSPLRSTWRTHNNDRNPDRRLRIGYVSPDFRRHSCRLFLEPLLAHHDKSQVEVYAYAELAKEDEVTARYKDYVEHWIPTRGMSDEILAERIRCDNIDILVELAGHTAGNRLLTFARKPAPVSLSWLGYGYTTGVRAIDYYLTDEACTPTGSEELFAEQPLRINTPSFVYRPSLDMGEVGSLPALQRGHITFGTLTRSVRINHHTIRVWSALLNSVPHARLVINSADFKSHAMQERMTARFSEHGIARERLEIDFHTPPWDVLRGIDIGLDCFPHNSGATLFETLYMGIPYITLAGRPSVGRLGSCILQGLGHSEWIAENEADYVVKAIELAGDINRLSEIRAGLRGQMENSPLRNEKNFALKIETAYRDIWKKWCLTENLKGNKP